MKLFVCWDSFERRMHIIADNPETLEWLRGPAAPVVRAAEEEMLHSRMTDDQHAWERPPPAGVVTPTLVAGALRAMLTAEFPDQTIEMSRGSRVGVVTLDYGVLS